MTARCASRALPSSTCLHWPSWEPQSCVFDAAQLKAAGYIRATFGIQQLRDAALDTTRAAVRYDIGRGAWLPSDLQLVTVFAAYKLWGAPRAEGCAAAGITR